MLGTREWQSYFIELQLHLLGTNANSVWLYLMLQRHFNFQHGPHGPASDCYGIWHRIRDGYIRQTVASLAP